MLSRLLPVLQGVRAALQEALRIKGLLEMAHEVLSDWVRPVLQHCLPNFLSPFLHEAKATVFSVCMLAMTGDNQPLSKTVLSELFLFSHYD